MSDWKARAQEIYPSEEFSTFNLVGISGALVLVEALKQAGPDLDRERFLEAMGAIKGFDTGIVAGTINCQPMVDHQCARGFAWIKKTERGIETETTTIFE
jgi:branched-chain amino acid transport system substrate-binding protein